MAASWPARPTAISIADFFGVPYNNRLSLSFKLCLDLRGDENGSINKLLQFVEPLFYRVAVFG